ncbi:MAG: cation:proton antiporter subunit C [Defluviitaleaceae bacterium]|nr:cation:proton antiporter subunit C [Defluviitaleaceae bacterium]
MGIHLFDIFPIVLFFISFYGLITTSNIIKSIVFIMLMQTSVIMFWLGVGARIGAMPPIIGDIAYLEYADVIADPLPQALMLTAIIIGIAVTAINVTMLNALFKKHKTVNWASMKARVNKEESSHEEI